MGIVDEAETAIETLTPGTYVWHGDSFVKVVEYPVTTERGVSVLLSNGDTRGPKPVGTMETVAVWG